MLNQTRVEMKSCPQMVQLEEMESVRCFFVLMMTEIKIIDGGQKKASLGGPTLKNKYCLLNLYNTLFQRGLTFFLFFFLEMLYLKCMEDLPPRCRSNGPGPKPMKPRCPSDLP